tara:strand:+ start:288 stop:422 length:135 start_codon:yes stop_codon:yes gene_type:complete
MKIITLTESEFDQALYMFEQMESDYKLGTKDHKEYKSLLKKFET